MARLTCPVREFPEHMCKWTQETRDPLVEFYVGGNDANTVVFPF